MTMKVNAIVMHINDNDISVIRFHFLITLCIEAILDFRQISPLSLDQIDV